MPEDYLVFAKSKKRSAKQIRKVLRKQLGYVVRDIRYLDEFMSDGYAMTSKETKQYLIIIKLYEQQKYMYDNKVHSVEHRTFSLSKRCYGIDCITTKLEETQLTFIALSVFVTNLFTIQKRILCALFISAPKHTI